MDATAAMIAIVVSGVVIIAARPYAAWIIRSQNRVGFNFGPRTERWTVPLVRLIGAFGVALGAYGLFISAK
jgi:hypothetical protein